MRTTKQRPAAVRLWEKVNKTDGCWLWTAALDSTGYGKLRRSRVDVRAHGGPHHWPAHRLAYELERGPIPFGMDLDHLCRNRACVNPDHLEPVTRQVNIRRGAGPAAQNAAKTHCIHGHQFTVENTRINARPNGMVSRSCRRCDAIYHQKKRAS